MTKKLWGGRFSAKTHPEVEAYTASINFDCALAQEDILGSIAHAKMLAHCNIISAAESAQLQQGLKQIAQEINAGDVAFHVTDEDIHMNIERLLGEKIGAVAGKLHTARSRNDQVALDIHLYLRKQIIITIDLLIQLQETLLAQASAHTQTLIPSYTHLQRAQPIYLTQHWLAYVAMFERDIARLRDCWNRTNQSPLGAAALAGTTFAIDKHYTAQLLGFDGVYTNTLDAVSDRDFVIEFLSAASLIMMHLSRMSEELILWSSQEFNFVSFADAFSTGSSIMPQKKNPDVVELGRGKTARVYGALLTLFTLLKGLPLAYNKDLQEDKEPLFDTVKTVQTTLSIYAPMLETLTIHTEVMAQAAQQGYLNATALAEYLVKQGMTFRAAHEAVGKMVAYAIQENCQLEDIPLAQMQTFAAVINDSVYDILAVKNSVATPDHQAALAIHAQEISLNRAWTLEQKNRLAQVYEQLEK